MPTAPAGSEFVPLGLRHCVCLSLVQGLLSGLVNGGPVAGGSIEQIEAQSNRRQPCDSSSFTLNLFRAVTCVSLRVPVLADSTAAILPSNKSCKVSSTPMYFS